MLVLVSVPVPVPVLVLQDTSALPRGGMCVVWVAGAAHPCTKWFLTYGWAPEKQLRITSCCGRRVSSPC